MTNPEPPESPDAASDVIEQCARVCEALCDGGEDDANLIAAAAAMRARAWDD